MILTLYVDSLFFFFYSAGTDGVWYLTSDGVTPTSTFDCVETTCTVPDGVNSASITNHFADYLGTFPGTTPVAAGTTIDGTTPDDCDPGYQPSAIVSTIKCRGGEWVTDNTIGGTKGALMCVGQCKTKQHRILTGLTSHTVAHFFVICLALSGSSL